MAKVGYTSLPVEGFDASIIRSPAIGRFFTLRWRAYGRYKYRSLRTVNVSRAMRRAKQLMVLIERGISPDTQCDFASLFEDYIKSRTCGRARLSQIEFFFEKYLREYWGDINVSSISQQDWVRYKEHRIKGIRDSGKPQRWRTLQHEVVIFRAFLRYCQSRHIISSMPVIEEFKKNDGALNPTKQRGAAYSPEEIQRVFSILRDRSDMDADYNQQSYYANQLYAYCVTLFFSASRAGEIKQLRFNDVEFFDDYALITIRAETSKVRKDRKTAIPKDAADILRTFMDWTKDIRHDDNGLIFYTYTDVTRVIQYGNQTFRRLMEEHNLYTNKNGTIRPLSSLRNSALTILSDNVSQAFLTSVAGTSSKMLRQHYFDRRASDLAGYTADIAETLLSSD